MDDRSLEFKFAEVNGIRLHYAARGSGRLMLFLHGFPEFWYAWHAQVDEFGRDHLAAAPDMRGFNLSSRPGDPDQYTIEYLVGDIRELAAHLSPDPFILAAHDWGGAVAWAFAAAHPELLDRLVIVNSPHPAVFARELQHNPAQRAASQYMRMFRRPEAEEILSANNYQAMFDALSEIAGRWRMSDRERELYLAAWSRPGALTGGLNYYRAGPLYPPAPGEPPRLEGLIEYLRTTARVRVPTLVIWGERDTALLTGNLDGLDEFVPDLTVVRVPDASHWILHEQPDRVNAAIRSFISRA